MKNLWPGRAKRRAPACDQVQASGLIGAVGPARTGGAAVAFVNQPHLGTSDVSSFHAAVNEFLQQCFQRLLVGNIQQQLRRMIRVEPIVTDGFHNGSSLRQETIPVHKIADEFSHVQDFDAIIKSNSMFSTS